VVGASTTTDTPPASSTGSHTTVKSPVAAGVSPDVMSVVPLKAENTLKLPTPMPFGVIVAVAPACRAACISMVAFMLGMRAIDLTANLACMPCS
jgi:hypothetical protein